jgi:hypothetical protein
MSAFSLSTASSVNDGCVKLKLCEGGRESEVGGCRWFHGGSAWADDVPVKSRRGKVGLAGLACDWSRSACFQQPSSALFRLGFR